MTSAGALPKPSRAPRIVAWAGIAVFLSLLGASHRLRDDLDPLRDDLSVYSVGPHAPLMRAAFVAMGVAVMATGWGALKSARAVGDRVLWPALLMVSGASGAAVAAFPTAAVDPVTPRDFAEVAASVVFFVGFAVASGAMSLSIAAKVPRNALTALSFGFDAAFVTMLLSPDAIHGLVMRGAVALLSGWVAVAATG